jgi:solute carrier family 25 (mitochondrial citrate transporter), member 1
MCCCVATCLLVACASVKKGNPLYSGLAGAMAGASSVVITMPQDTVKSRMQSETSKEMYSSTLDCFQKILKTEGFATLFSGTIPRLVRVSLDVGKHSTPSHH